MSFKNEVDLFSTIYGTRTAWLQEGIAFKKKT
jgi:hypothetical protein